MEPLTAWRCDQCGRLTREYADGTSDHGSPWVIWKVGDKPERKEYGFRIVHKVSCDPGDRGGYTMSADMETFLGERGQAYLLSMISGGPAGIGNALGVADLDEWVDFFRRVQTRWYEEARSQFGNPAVALKLRELGSDSAYRPEELERIANREDA